MDIPEKELEEHLREAGYELAQFPSEVDKLLPLLDKVENLLAKVEQSPSESIQNAYSQSMKMLLAEPLLRHKDVDVQVAVASCISEITRITAPEAPYDDDQMKEVFRLIVSSFADLSDMDSRSYGKRASILETVAKVRSCVVMLDLECDALILEMFQHFLSSIRDDHPKNIIMSMETTMILVLEESEDISLELLTPILATLKRDNEEIPPVARKLGENVFAKCAVKLQPYLKQAVKSLGISLDGYSKIVAAICNGSAGEVEHNEDNVSVEQLAVESKTSSDEIARDAKDHVTEEPCLEEVAPEVEKSVMLGNGITETGDAEMPDVSDSSKKPDDSNLTAQSLDVNINEVETNDLDTGKLAKVESKQVKTAKRRGRKPFHKKASDPSRIDAENEAEVSCAKESDKEADELPDCGKDTHVSVGEDPHVDTHASPEREHPPISSPKLSDSEVDVSPLSTNKIIPDESSLPAKVGMTSKIDNLAQGDAIINSALEKTIAGESGTETKQERDSEKDKHNLTQGDEVSTDSAPVEAADVNSDSEVKSQSRGKKKENFVQEQASSKDPCASIVEAADGGSDLEIKPQKLASKKKEQCGQEDEAAEDFVSPKVSDGSSDSEAKVQTQSGKKTDNLVQEDVQPLEPLSPKVDDEISDSADKPQRRSGKKAARTKKRTTRVMKGKMLKGRGTSKTEKEDDSDEEGKQLAQSAEGVDKSDTDTKPLEQSGKVTGRCRGQSLKKSGKRNVSGTKPTNKKQEDAEENGSDSDTNEDGSDSETKPPVQTGKDISSRSRGQSLKNSGKGNVSGTKLSSKEDTVNNDKDSTKKDNSRRRAHGGNTKGRDVLKSQAKDDDQDMITSPKSDSELVKDEDRVEDTKDNAKRKRESAKDKVSGDLEYGMNLVGARIKVWWPADKEYYEGTVESFNSVKKKHKVSYVDGDVEVLVLKKEKWEFVDEEMMQDADEDLNPNSSAKLRSRKKAKTNSEQSSKQKQMGVSPRSGRSAAATSKLKGTATKSGGKVDSKLKDKASKTTGKSWENSESDDNSADDEPVEGSKSGDDDDGAPKAKSKLETPKTVTKAKAKTPQSGNTANGTGKGKSASSKVKDAGNHKGKSSDSGKTPETAKTKSANTSKAGKSGGKSGRKRRRGL